MSQNLAKGRKGEELALQYLVKEGFQIRERNWRYRQKEIDLILTDRNDLVFVEVKARYSDKHGAPVEFVTRGKQKLLIAAANAYAEQIDWPGPIRFDVVAITYRPQYKLEHFREAFYP